MNFKTDKGPKSGIPAELTQLMWSRSNPPSCLENHWAKVVEVVVEEVVEEVVGDVMGEGVGEVVGRWCWRWRRWRWRWWW